VEENKKLCVHAVFYLVGVKKKSTKKYIRFHIKIYLIKMIDLKKNMVLQEMI